MQASGAVSMRAVAVCGCGHDGRLGLGKGHSSTATPVLLPAFMPTHVSAAADASTSSTSNTVTPPPPPRVLGISCGGYHTIARTSDGLYGWGLNDCGQLGLGPKVPAAYVPTRLPFFGAMSCVAPAAPSVSSSSALPRGEELTATEYVVDVACGLAHSMVLTNKALYACGANMYGQLGLGQSAVTPIGSAGVTSWTQLCRFAPFPHGGQGPTAPGADSADSLVEQQRHEMHEVLSIAGGSIVAGVVTHVSCGTHHTLLAWKDTVLLLTERDAVEARYYPTLLTAAGKGDYGELGFDGDLEAITRSKNERVQRAALAHATQRQQQQQQQQQSAEPTAVLQCEDPRAPEVSSDVVTVQPTPPVSESSDTLLPPGLQKWKEKFQKTRRQEFNAPLFGLVQMALLISCPCAVSLTGDNGTGDVRLDCGTDDIKRMTAEQRWDVVSLSAMHLHSSATLQHIMQRDGSTAFTDGSTLGLSASSGETVERDPQRRSPAEEGAGEARTFHWGCYYCNEIEDDAASIPQETQKSDSALLPTFVHAGSELILSYCPYAKRSEVCSVMGSGIIGLGQEDSFVKEWTPIAGSANVVKVVGGEHTLLLQSLATASPPATAVLGFGDNTYGQLGAANGSPRRIDRDTITSPRVLLQAGDHLPGGWVVERIHDIGAGARHSVYLIDISRNE